LAPERARHTRAVSIAGFHSVTATDDWEHALISGDGRQGALCYGRLGTVRVTLSHERLFLPMHEPLPAPGTATILPALRALLLAGRYQDAADAVVEHAIGEDARYAELRQIDPLVAAATLTIRGLPAANPGSYRRATDFGSGVVSQRWDGSFTQQLFVSRADAVVVLRLRNGGRPFDAVLTLAAPDDSAPVPVEVTTMIAADRIGLATTFPTAWDGAIRGYVTAGRVIAIGGVVRPIGTGLSGEGVTELLLLIRTEVPGIDVESTLDDLGGLPADWELLLGRHTARHRPLVENCRLDLHADPLARAGSSEELLAAPDQPALIERLFTAGRYAIASSTGELPPTLQGVWSGNYRPAWGSGYTLDGNLFAAVSALLPTGTPELLLPVFDLLESHLADFRDNARRLYATDGILVPPHLSTHGRHNHFGPRWCLTFWTAAAGWAAMLFHDYWRYTGDEVFRRTRALPFLREVAAFAAEFMLPDGTLVPSYSPENAPSRAPENAPGNAPEDSPEDAPAEEPERPASQAAVNATMDIAVLRALVTALAEAGEEPPGLGARLPGYRIDPDGTLAEWAWPGLRANHAHRHASHLIGLWYEPDPAILGDPALTAAARLTVAARLAWWRRSDRVAGRGCADAADPVGSANSVPAKSVDAAGEMAFGLVQLGLAAAALGLGEDCHEIITWLAGAYWRPNLVATHNAGEIFNVDICGGLPALVAAMLLGSTPGHLTLLPALPAAWPTGEITGLAARGQVVVERLAWSAGAVSVRLRSPHDQRVRVTVDRTQSWVDLPAGEPVGLNVNRAGPHG
jgi:alpha-L-fucosidase 2